MRRNALATSESMRCGACSCSLARELRAGPSLSRADRAAEASTTITCWHAQRPGCPRSWRCPCRNRAGYRATQGCPLCATRQRVPVRLLPRPMLRRERRAAPSARRHHPARSASRAFSCCNMLAKSWRGAKGEGATCLSTSVWLPHPNVRQAPEARHHHTVGDVDDQLRDLACRHTPSLARQGHGIA